MKWWIMLFRKKRGEKKNTTHLNDNNNFRGIIIIILWQFILFLLDSWIWMPGRTAGRDSRAGKTRGVLLLLLSILLLLPFKIYKILDLASFSFLNLYLSIKITLHSRNINEWGREWLVESYLPDNQTEMK